MTEKITGNQVCRLQRLGMKILEVKSSKQKQHVTKFREED